MSAYAAMFPKNLALTERRKSASASQFCYRRRGKEAGGLFYLSLDGVYISLPPRLVGYRLHISSKHVLWSATTSLHSRLYHVVKELHAGSVSTPGGSGYR